VVSASGTKKAWVASWRKWTMFCRPNQDGFR